MPSVSFVAPPARPLRRSGCGPVVSPGYSGLVWLYIHSELSVAAGHVTAVWPLGSAWPSSSRAVAVPPSEPAFHMLMTALTFGLSIHGLTTTGPAVLSTTTVFGLTAATALMRLTCEEVSCEMTLVGPLAVVVPESCANTSAIALPFAALAASAMSPVVIAAFAWPSVREYTKRKLAG